MATVVVVGLDVVLLLQPFKLFGVKFMQRFLGHKQAQRSTIPAGVTLPRAAHLQSKYLLYKLEEHFKWHLAQVRVFLAMFTRDICRRGEVCCLVF